MTVRAWTDAESLNLQIEDRGRGFDPDAARAAGGLASMRDRTALLGGQLSVDSAPGGGTRVTAGLPLNPPPEPQQEA